MVGRKLSRVEQRHVEQFFQRKALAAKRPRIDNGKLVAGSPMYYYCKGCGTMLAVLPETHLERPPQHCEPCLYLIDHALMPPPDDSDDRVNGR